VNIKRPQNTTVIKNSSKNLKKQNTTNKLSEAEILRNERIKQNDEFLKSLGLGSSSSHIPIKTDIITKKKKIDKEKKQKYDIIEEPTRKSSRKAGLLPDIIDSSYINNFVDNENSIKVKRIKVDDFKVDVNPDDDNVKRNKYQYGRKYR
jgi:hypothetical protein